MQSTLSTAQSSFSWPMRFILCSRRWESILDPILKFGLASVIIVPICFAVAASCAKYLVCREFSKLYRPISGETGHN